MRMGKTVVVPADDELIRLYTDTKKDPRDCRILVNAHCL